MSIYFNPEDHTYKSVNDPDFKWTSVTDLIKQYKNPFDKEKVALECSKKKKSKWYGLKVEEILSVWEKENEQAIEIGNWYHKQREDEIKGLTTINVNGCNLNIYPSDEMSDGKKMSGDQCLVEGIYPEHFIYLKSIGLCGQADRVEVVNGTVNIIDYKSNRKIDTEAFLTTGGAKKTMLPPLKNLNDINLNHYTLQLSLYLYMILKHNPNLKEGKLTIQHVIFKTVGEDKYGYPIYERDSESNPIIDHIEMHDVPYLKNEVSLLVERLKRNKYD